MPKYPTRLPGKLPVLLPILILLAAVSIYVLNQLNSYSLPETANFLQPTPASRDYQAPIITPTPSKKVKLTLLGDIMLGRTVMTTTHSKNDPLYPVQHVKEPLNQSDIVIANLENPVIQNCPPHTTGYKFCSTVDMLKNLKAANISVVSLANNHSHNYGDQGLQETLEHLQSFNISAIGLDNLVIKSVDNHQLGFLGFNYIAAGPDQNDLDLVKTSDSKVDTLVASIHWGHEYTATASALQRKWASQLVDLGVDVIFGHHPHWIQDSQMINQSPVYYSLGNFIFDQMWSQKTRRGLVVDLIYQDKELIEQKTSTVFQENWAQPKFID